MGLSLELTVVLLLIVLNGLFAMSELALVSAKRARLAVLERQGHKGATTARILSEDAQLFLPIVQVGITLVSVLAGVFGGARITARLQAGLETMPSLRPFAETIAFLTVVIITTFLTLVIGELACGNIKNREQVLSLLNNLPEAPAAMHDEAIEFLEAHSLAGRGLGWIDIHLLASTSLASARLWTVDRRLALAAKELRLEATL